MTARRVAAALGLALLLVGCTSGEQRVRFTEYSGESSSASTSAAEQESAVDRLRADSAMAFCVPEAPPTDRGLPDVALPCLGIGADVSLATVRGPAVVNLWASWCGPCRDEAPILEQARQRAADRVRFLGVNFKDDPEPALEAAAAWSMTYPSLQDPDGDLAADLRVTGLPVTLFVRADGTVAGRKDGPIRSEAELEELLARHLDVRL